MGLQLTRQSSHGVSLLVGEGCPQGISFAFTERAGGVSDPPFASLNVGSAVGDGEDAVQENRRRALSALGVDARYHANLIVPNQVHGTNVCVVRKNTPSALDALRQEIRAGCDAVVCGVPGVPVMLCFADCVPVVLVAPRAFAVIHSGWRGTRARIAARALDVLCREAAVAPVDVMCAIGPHIAGSSYEVSDELLEQFVDAFGEGVRYVEGAQRSQDAARPSHKRPSHQPPSHKLDLAEAVRIALQDAGMPRTQITTSDISTTEHIDRFYSYRAERGCCGRFAAMAWIDPVVVGSALASSALSTSSAPIQRPSALTHG